MDMVMKKREYVDKDGVVVVPFHIDLQRGLVRFARVGSSRESELSINEFMERYSLKGEKREAQTSKSKRPAEEK